MKISYRREMKHNYLIIDPEELNWKNYECSMLEENSVEGVLNFQLRRVDDEVRFYYEITSRQPLSRLLENQAVRTEEIRRLVLGISSVLDRMEPYLLREGCILLEPDYIYVEPESFRVWLCLVPGLDRDFPEDYGKWLEYLLGKVDHQDKESVVLVYGMYQETRKENYGMEDVLRLIQTSGGEETQSEAVEEVPEVIQQPVPVREPEVSSEKPGLWERIRQWLSRRKASEEDSSIRVPLELLFREEEEPVKQQLSGNRAQKPCSLPCERDTVLLTDLSKGAGTELRCLRPLDKGMETIMIPYFPFIIGKQENLADYLLLYDTVSRLHVRIDQDDDGWNIQDLNSTNGTMVGGKLLNTNETVKLHIGDELQIAEFRYRFE